MRKHLISISLRRVINAYQAGAIGPADLHFRIHDIFMVNGCDDFLARSSKVFDRLMR